MRRYEEIGRLLTGRVTASADDGIESVRQLVEALCIPSLGSYGMAKTDIADIIKKAAKAGSMKANPIVLTTEEQQAILERAL